MTHPPIEHFAAMRDIRTGEIQFRTIESWLEAWLLKMPRNVRRSVRRDVASLREKFAAGDLCAALDLVGALDAQFRIGLLQAAGTAHRGGKRGAAATHGPPDPRARRNADIVREFTKLRQ